METILSSVSKQYDTRALSSNESRIDYSVVDNDRYVGKCAIPTILVPYQIVDEHRYARSMSREVHFCGVPVFVDHRVPYAQLVTRQDRYETRIPVLCSTLVRFRVDLTVYFGGPRVNLLSNGYVHGICILRRTLTYGIRVADFLERTFHELAGCSRPATFSFLYVSSSSSDYHGPRTCRDFRLFWICVWNMYRRAMPMFVGMFAPSLLLQCFSST